MTDKSDAMVAKLSKLPYVDRVSYDGLGRFRVTYPRTRGGHIWLTWSAAKAATDPKKGS